MMRLKIGMSVKIVLCLILILSSISALAGERKEDETGIPRVDAAILDLEKQIVGALGTDKKPVLAITDFIDPEGQITGLGRYVSEELLGQLVREKMFRVVERRYLEKMMNEIKLGMSGMVSDETAKGIGKIVGADAIVTGSYGLMGKKVKITARVVAVESGDVLATGNVQVDKEEVATLMRQVIESAPTSQPRPGSPLLDESSAPVQVESVEAEGAASIRNENADLARDNAVDDALRKAVEQSMGILIDSQTLVENNRVIADRILSQTRGYVRSYRISSERREGNFLRVMIRAEVTVGDLKKDLAAIGVLLGQKHKPRTMVMIAERNIGQSGYLLSWHDGKKDNLSVAENAFIENLSQKGFPFVDLDAVSGVIQSLEKGGRSYGKADLSSDQVKSLGRKLDAEVVVIGKVRASPGGEIKNLGDFTMKSVQADLSARAVRTDTGEVIASASVTGTAIHINETTAGSQAIQKAANELAEKMAEQILAKYSSEVGGTASVRMVIMGLNHQQLARFKNVLSSEVRGVKTIHQRSFEGGAAHLDIDLKGDAQAIADELSTKEFKNFTVDVISVTASSVKVNVKQK